MLTDVAFVIFMITWLIARQVMYLFIVSSVTSQISKASALDVSGSWISTRTSLIVLSAGLSMMYVLFCVWYYLICRIVYGIVMGKPAEDSRSDDEDE